jgi:GNAT superfamily N-acetyltransferase
MAHVSLADSDPQIQSCFPVLSQLRPHISSDDFLSRIRAQMSEGYRLAYVAEGASVVAVAGFRIGNSLSWGKFLYVDDLVTDEHRRSRGYGQRLLAWLHDHARACGCAQLHLDSGIRRAEAHRFYKREGMAAMAYHFVAGLSESDGDGAVASAERLRTPHE